MAIEQDNDIIPHLQLKQMNEEYSETILLQDRQFQVQSHQLDRLLLTYENTTRQSSD